MILFMLNITFDLKDFGPNISLKSHLPNPTQDWIYGAIFISRYPCYESFRR